MSVMRNEFVFVAGFYERQNLNRVKAGPLGMGAYMDESNMFRALPRVTRRVEILIPISKTRRLGHAHVARDDRVHCLSHTR